MDNLDKMVKLLESYNLPKLNQKETENLNRLITTSDVEVVIKKLPTNKFPRQDHYKGEFYQKFNEELTNTYSSQTLPKNLRVGKPTKLISCVHIILIPKTVEDITKKENYRLDEYRC